MRRHQPILVVLGLGAASLVALALLPAGTGTARIAEATDAGAVATLAAISPKPPIETPAAAATALTDTTPAVPAAPSVAEAKYEMANADTAATLAPDVTSIEPPAPPALTGDLHEMWVGSSAVNMRSGPGTSNDVLTVLQPGQKIEAGDSDGGWVHVALADGTSGWVYSTYLGTTPQAAAPAPPARTAERSAPDAHVRAVVSGGSGVSLAGRTARVGSMLPVRPSPSGAAPVLFELHPGDAIRIADERGSWLRIETDDGLSGWIQRAS